ncbi:3-oxoacyl-(acyl-carrier-protein) reductase [Roseibium sp. TrichSKD4]|uniref:3-ketoacyl-ACP reductase n=1 Tax=Roseibium sp. TrichSKD4 TaxID=744980 RepID=UPI0001E56D66|nr:3-ketoacyl-ACP reductase [Roseibium sp. TrichSKD4]EFO31970.1 3-oxoacyl-(acyl-carrier-protein) reductase [Roseibium sp. TrichSKD4]
MSKVALITGGQSGIGLGIAKALAGAGYRVALAAERASDDVVVKDALAELGSPAAYFQHDLAQIKAIPALLDTVETQHGPVTTFVSNAGVPAKVRGDLLDMTPDSFDFVMDINLRGAFFLAQEVARRIVSTRSPDYRSLSFITSVSAEMVSVERGEYCISKAASSMMARLFAARLAPHDIGVFELRPGIIETGMTAAVKDKYTARIEDGLIPACRWGKPADIGSIILSLAEGQMAFATGSVIPVDGGLSIPRL